MFTRPDKLIRKMREYVESVIWFQRRVRDMLAVKDGKVEVLENYWDKLHGLVMTRAIERKD